MEENKKVEYVDMTPTWTEVLGVLADLAIGAPNSRQMVSIIKELKRPCAMVDKWNAENKAKVKKEGGDTNG